ncbi:hypothetical protein ILYODFUR_038470, partial [Ilyodon furcidens]
MEMRQIWIIFLVRMMLFAGQHHRWTPAKRLKCVSRDSVIERGLQLWLRQKNGGPVNPLKVSFLGELGVDTGALRKEFLTTMVAGIENRLFEGD